jgi:hypothetical protein
MLKLATPHRGSSYMSMPNLRESIQHLLYLSKPLPRSITDQLRLNHKSLLKLHDQFTDIASEMHIWTFYETIDSQLSGLGTSIIDEVHFSAPLASIKSGLLLSRHEQAFSLDSDHAHCASFGPHNIEIMHSYLEDLGQAIRKAEKLSSSFVHTPLKLADKVKVELIGFYDDPDPETVSDVRLYVSRHYLNEFLSKGPERCLQERLNTVAPRPRRGGTLPPSQLRAQSSGGLGNLGGIWNNVQGFGQRIFNNSAPRPGSSPQSPMGGLGIHSPEIVITSHSRRPSIPTSTAMSAPAVTQRLSRGLTVPALSTPGFHTASGRDSSQSGRTDSDETARTLSDPTGTEISPRTVDPDIKRDGEPGTDDQDFDPATKARKDRISKTSALQDLTAGFSRPDPSKRKFMWIHLPFNNPHWVKACYWLPV